jgi:6-phosphogluconolactonase (cycloisomerase 2 family)
MPIVDNRNQGGGGGVNSVNGDTGPDVVLTKTSVGLGNVLNLDQSNPSNIVQDSTHRFVTDAEKTTWNAGGSGGGIIDTDYITNDKSATFNGTTSYIDYGNTFNKDRTDAFSISFWLKTTSTTTSQFPVSKRASTTTPGFYLQLESNNRFLCSFGNSSTNAIAVRTPVGTALTANVWSHIVVTYSGSSTAAGLKVYKDGVPFTMSTVTDALTLSCITTSTLKLGQLNGTFFGGQIDDFTTWNTELDAYDVYELFSYQTRKDILAHTKVASFANWWKLGDGDTTSSLDSKGSATGTLTSVTFATDTPFSSDGDIENYPADTYDALIVQGRTVAITPYGTPTALTTPASIPPTQGNAAEWSPSGRLLAVGHQLTAGVAVTIYERIGESLVKLPNNIYAQVGHCTGIAWSPCERFLYLSQGSPTYMYMYERNGNTFTRLPLPATTPTGLPSRVVVSPDGRLVTYAHQTSPYITTYERGGTFGNTFAKLADPATLPTGDAFSAAYSPDGALLAVGLSANAVELYTVSGSTLTKVSGSFATGGAVSHLAWSPNGKFLSAVFPTAGGYVFRRIGNALYRMPAYDTPPTGTSYSSGWSPDSKFLYVGHSDSGVGYCSVYELQNERKFVKQSWTTGLPGNGRSISVTNDGKFTAVAHATSPFISWFKSSGAAPKVDGRKARIVGPQSVFTHSLPSVGDPSQSYLHPSLGDVFIERWNTNTTAGRLGWTETLNGGSSAMSAGAFGTAQLQTGASATAAPTLALSTTGHWAISAGTFCWETRMSLSAASSGTDEYIARIGFNNAATTGAMGTNFIGFEYDRLTSTFWRCICKSSVTGLTTTVTTSLAFTTGARVMKIHVTSTLVTFFIDGTIVAQITTDIPTSNVIPVYNMVKSVGTTSRVMFLYWSVLATGQAATAN